MVLFIAVALLVCRTRLMVGSLVEAVVVVGADTSLLRMAKTALLVVCTSKVRSTGSNER